MHKNGSTQFLTQKFQSRKNLVSAVYSLCATPDLLNHDQKPDFDQAIDLKSVEKKPRKQRPETKNDAAMRTTLHATCLV